MEQSFSDQKFFITGGAGFIGRALANGLVRCGAEVVVFDNNSRGDLGKLRNGNDLLNLVAGDVRKAEDVVQASKGCTSIVHLAAVNGTSHFYESPDLVLDVAVRGMLSVLDACQAHKIGQLFVVSSSEVYQTADEYPTPETVEMSIPDPLNPRYSYAGGKIISELLALHHKMDHLQRVCIVRPHNVYGPDMGSEHVIPQFIAKMIELQKEKTAKMPPATFPIQGTGEETRSFVFIDDFVSGFIKILEAGQNREIYNIGTTDEISILALAEVIAAQRGLSLNILPGELSQGSTLRRCPNIEKIKALGFCAETSLSAGIKKTLDWHIENGDHSR